MAGQSIDYVIGSGGGFVKLMCMRMQVSCINRPCWSLSNMAVSICGRCHCPW